MGGNCLLLCSRYSGGRSKRAPGPEKAGAAEKVTGDISVRTVWPSLLALRLKRAGRDAGGTGIVLRSGRFGSSIRLLLLLVREG
jgi:hypothetical protein